MDLSHLNALEIRLSHERDSLSSAKSQKEIETRKVWVAQIEKEIAREKAYIGYTGTTLPEISDDELMAELES